MAPALPRIASHFHITNDTEVALTLSIYMLSYAFSPLLFAPLSEMFGRTWVGFHIKVLLQLPLFNAFLGSSHQQFVIYRFQPGLCICAIQGCPHLLPISQYVKERLSVDRALRVAQAVGLVAHRTPLVGASLAIYSPLRIEPWQWRSTPSVPSLVGLNTLWLLASL
jgi:MFS family permease